MRIALDTNRYGDVATGDEQALEELRGFDALVLPYIVVAELRAGFRAGSRATANEKSLNAFLEEEAVSVLYPDAGTTDFYAELHVQLRRLGRPIPDNDLWIAALCVQHGIPLYTRDRHFEGVPRLVRL
jgi:tRNA(fMet)-specific endonuclease VapC